MLLQECEQHRILPRSIESIELYPGLSRDMVPDTGIHPAAVLHPGREQLRDTHTVSERRFFVPTVTNNIAVLLTKIVFREVYR